MLTTGQEDWPDFEQCCVEGKDEILQESIWIEATNLKATSPHQHSNVTNVLHNLIYVSISTSCAFQG